ncbi:glycolate oxidase subunit GlcF [Massilia sp. W12]|uniref:glycolate oxidase subunit GlcF n=1 Tax=Massilia sp. W12 TaxID=3126507 RepID=UPI0030D08584
MQTRLADFIQAQQQGQDAERILRACVHCGFCTAVCPTYQLLGDERDSPRGRIYLIKQMLEGAPPTQITQTHLDRCLSCRSCESACPSGVEYAHLLEIGRKVAQEQVKRPWRERAKRALWLNLFARPALFGALLRLGRPVRQILPAPLRAKLPPPFPNQGTWPEPPVAPVARVLLFEPCVQDALNPNLNAATARMLARLGVQTLRLPQPQCCGALDLHGGREAQAQARMQNMLQAALPLLQADADLLLLSNASGCGLALSEFGRYFAHDAALAAGAALFSARVRDIAQILPQRIAASPWRARLQACAKPHLAWHAPCSMQHGLRLGGLVEACLRELGFSVHLPQDAHLCCGSAGSWSVLQPALSIQLRERKLAALQHSQDPAVAPEYIVSANIGCQGHLAAASPLPVRHWVELLDSLCSRLEADGTKEQGT